MSQLNFTYEGIAIPEPFFDSQHLGLTNF